MVAEVEGEVGRSEGAGMWERAPSVVEESRINMVCVYQLDSINAKTRGLGEMFECSRENAYDDDKNSSTSNSTARSPTLAGRTTSNLESEYKTSTQSLCVFIANPVCPKHAYQKSAKPRHNQTENAQDVD
jgi:hypothetical protein